MNTTRTLAITALSALALLGAVACGGDSKTESPTTAPASNTTASGATSAPTSASGATTAATKAATTAAKVNANTATQAEVSAALKAAGVPNPDNWAKEVVEYRPYPTTDATFAKLRTNLAKYNPPAGVVDQIIAVLKLD